MSHVGLCLLSLTFCLFQSFTKQIQNAFLGNEPRALHSLLTPGTYLPVSLPAPIGFSDLVSDQQAYFLFRKIFNAHPTTGFYPEGDLLGTLDRGSFIYKARWEFLTSAGGSEPFRVMFYVRRSPPASRSPSIWTITEIRATRIRPESP